MSKKIASMVAVGIAVCMLLLSGVVLAESGYAVHYSDKFQGRKTANVQDSDHPLSNVPISYICFVFK